MRLQGRGISCAVILVRYGSSTLTLHQVSLHRIDFKMFLTQLVGTKCQPTIKDHTTFSYGVRPTAPLQLNITIRLLITRHRAYC